jgi:hypothetical protein
MAADNNDDVLEKLSHLERKLDRIEETCMKKDE